MQRGLIGIAAVLLFAAPVQAREPLEGQGVTRTGDAVIKRVIQLPKALGLGVLLTEGHGAETNTADVDAGSAKRTVVHGRGLLIWKSRLGK